MPVVGEAIEEGYLKYKYKYKYFASKIQTEGRSPSNTGQSLAKKKPVVLRRSKW